MKNLLLTALVAVSISTYAKYPDQAITLIVPTSAGGGTDAIARAFAQGLKKELGVNVSVIDRPGAGGVIGHNAILRAKPDGYTIGLSIAEVATYKWIGNADFDVTQLTPIALLNFDASGFQVQQNSPWKNAKEALSAIKEAPKGTYKMSGVAIAAPYHLAFANFLKKNGIDPNKVTMIPSQGAAPGFQQMAAGVVQILPSSLPEGRAMMEAGRVKALAVLDSKRNPAFPDIPTAKEATGVEVVGGTWRGLIGPEGMNQEATKTLEAAAKKVYDSKNFQDFMNKQGYGMEFKDSAEFTTFIKEQSDNYHQLIDELGLGK